MIVTLYYYPRHLNASNPYIKIQLFDNITVNKWAKQYQDDQYKVWFDSYSATTRKELTVANVDYWWKLLHQLIKQIKTMGYQFPFELEKHFDYDQQTLNKLHRVFTINQDWLDKGHLDSHPLDPNFILPYQDKNKWELLIGKINSAVHNLEKFTLPGLNRDFVDDYFPIESYSYSSIRSSHRDRWIQFDEEDLRLNYNYLDLNHKHIVTLDKSILGKSVLQSFYENDDPTAFDCTGRLGSSGGFVIDTNNNRKEIYQSVAFESWLDEYNLNLKDMPLEFSIGHVVHATDDLNEFKNFQFAYIEFRD